MTVHVIASESDHTVLKWTDTVLIDFWSPVCPPCKAFAPIFEEASHRHPDVAFCKVNTREEEELSGAFEVEHIPDPGGHSGSSAGGGSTGVSLRRADR